MNHNIKLKKDKIIIDGEKLPLNNFQIYQFPGLDGEICITCTCTLSGKIVFKENYRNSPGEFSPRVSADLSYFDKFKDCIIIENESFSLDVFNDLKMMHGFDVESELNYIIRQCTIRFPQTEDGNYIKGLFTLILKKQNEQMRLDKIKEDFE